MGYEWGELFDSHDGVLTFRKRSANLNPITSVTFTPDTSGIQYTTIDVQRGDEVGPRGHEVLVAALEVGTAEVVRPEVVGLHPRAEPAVEDEHAIAEGGEEAGHRAGSLRGRSRPDPRRRIVRTRAPGRRFRTLPR